jgi:hypothetical protein
MGNSFCQNISACFIQATIDGGHPYVTNIDLHTLDVVLYSTPILPDGDHHLQLVMGSDASLEIDYALVTAGTKTSLKNQHIIANYTDPSIQYKGQWTKSSDGKAMESITPGDTLEISFAGTASDLDLSVTIY